MAFVNKSSAVAVCVEEPREETVFLLRQPELAAIRNPQRTKTTTLRIIMTSCTLRVKRGGGLVKDEGDHRGLKRFGRRDYAGTLKIVKKNST